MGKTMTFEAVSIILGATDEDEALQKTVDEIMSLCAPEDIAKFVLVEKPGISQHFLEIIDGLCEKYGEKILPIGQKRPLVGGAIQDGMDAITSSHTMLLASDLAQDLSCVPLMIEGAKTQPDVIFSASRFLEKGSFHGYSKPRLFANKCGQVFLRLLFGGGLTDYTNPVQIAPTQLYSSIQWQEYGFPFLLEMVLKPLRLGCKFVEIPTGCYERSVGKSNNSFLQTAKYLPSALKFRLMKKEKIFKESCRK